MEQPSLADSMAACVAYSRHRPGSSPSTLGDPLLRKIRAVLRSVLLVWHPRDGLTIPRWM